MTLRCIIDVLDNSDLDSLLSDVNDAYDEPTSNVSENFPEKSQFQAMVTMLIRTEQFSTQNVYK